MRKFYAFQFFGGRRTTTGHANPRTGRFSIAGELKIFTTAQERADWVSAGKVTSAMAGICREIITAKYARRLCAGMTLSEFNELVYYIS